MKYATQLVMSDLMKCPLGQQILPVGNLVGDIVPPWGSAYKEHLEVGMVPSLWVEIWGKYDLENVM